MDDDEKGGGLGSLLSKLAIGFLVLGCLFHLGAWCARSKVRSWIFASVFCTVFSGILITLGLAMITAVEEIFGTRICLNLAHSNWYASALCIVSAISGMIWAAIDTEKMSQAGTWDGPGEDTLSLAACCVVGIALVIPAVIGLKHSMDAASQPHYPTPAEMGWTEPPAPRSRIWLRFPRSVSDAALRATNYRIIGYPHDGKPGYVTVFQATRLWDSAVQLETSYIPAHGQYRFEIKLSSDLAAYADGGVKAEIQ